MKMKAQTVFLIAICGIMVVAGIMIFLYYDDDPGVKYYGNGGTTSDGKTDFFNGNDEAVENTFSYDGHTFLYWNTEPDGSGRSYKVGHYVNSDKSLYAQWAPKSFGMVINYSQTDGPEAINILIKDANGIRNVAVSSVVTEDVHLSIESCRITITDGSGWRSVYSGNSFGIGAEHVYTGTINGKDYDMDITCSGLNSILHGTTGDGEPQIEFDFIFGHSQSLSINLTPHK